MHPAELFWTATIGFVVVGSLGWLLSIYNGFIELRNQIGRAWANIDVLLKQRYDEVPKLVSICEGHMAHERAVFDRLSDARAALAGVTSVKQRADAEGRVGRALGDLIAVAEAVPELRSSETFRALQQRVSELENRIADRREFYNDVVTIHNTRLEQLPDAWIGQGMRLVPAEHYRIASVEREDPGIEWRRSA